MLTFPGAGILNTIKKARCIIDDSHWSLIFCLAGICDLTMKDPKSKTVATRYVNPFEAQVSFKAILEAAYKILSKESGIKTGSKCIFAPITGMRLDVHNKRPGHTIDLVNQFNLNETIPLINSDITEFNSLHGFSTPWTSCTIHRRTRKSFTNNYEKLATDGCHLSPLVLKHWADALHDAILKNI